jgi:hypothetical protein
MGPHHDVDLTTTTTRRTVRTEQTTSAPSQLESTLREFLHTNHIESTNDPLGIDVIYPPHDH